MIASILLGLAYKGSYVLVLFGLVYLAVRYFDGQLSRRSATRLAGLIVLPTLVFLILAVFLPYKWTVWPAWYVFDHFISVWNVLIPLAVFVIVTKMASQPLQRATLYTGLFVVLGMLSNHIFQILGDLLPPFDNNDSEQEFGSALLELGMLLIPASALVASKTLGVRIPLWLCCFGIALLFSPVIYFLYGRFVVVSSMHTLIYLSVADGSNLAVQEVLMMIVAAVSLIVPTMALMWLNSFAQRLRTPATD